ncbi:hypothetical protein JG687_00006241 [Phytophthora cactorum]|uniref:Uncharacterized protein n=1 Tax=Phytophthora cactorum TaxID=29920 RepID=A0A8T1UK22_9STRA|nr:hypothetical protein JG687_00006241 [Phytophthora cactorum]
MDANGWSFYVQELLKFDIEALSVILIDNFDATPTYQWKELMLSLRPRRPTFFSCLSAAPLSASH